MLLGIDDTDSPRGMCTTYLGAVLAGRLIRVNVPVREARLVRLNPNVPFKTRGNAAICLETGGNLREVFRMACRAVEDFGELTQDETRPGVVAVKTSPTPEFYRRAVQDFCTLDEAIAILDTAGALYKGWNGGRGLIGATAAVCSRFADSTYELLAYRDQKNWGTPRSVERESFFSAEAHTYPHTWDTVDREDGVVVCVPHTPDPVLFGIRGERPGWISYAREYVHSEKPALEQMWITNQGTDAHLVPGRIGCLNEGLSYLLPGTVACSPVTGKGGHVSFFLRDESGQVRCMAYEPTKGFRDLVRGLREGDRLVVAGSYKRGSINLEKLLIRCLAEEISRKPPLCERCGKRMTSAGTGKGYKCRRCGGRATIPVIVPIDRNLPPGWYEVPPIARRHLARPLCRGSPEIPEGASGIAPAE